MELIERTDWLYGIWLASLVGCTCIIVYTDIAWYWIPDAVVCVVAISNGIGWLAGLFQPNLWLGMLIAAFFFLAYVWNPNGIGSGDIKLTAALCLGCTGYMAYGMTAAACVTALGTACCLRLRAKPAVIPFGPFLWLGWWSAFFMKEEWQAWLLLGSIIPEPMGIFCGNCCWFAL